MFHFDTHNRYLRVMPFKDSLILGIIDVYDFCISKEDLNFEKKLSIK